MRKTFIILFLLLILTSCSWQSTHVAGSTPVVTPSFAVTALLIETSTPIPYTKTPMQTSTHSPGPTASITPFTSSTPTLAPMLEIVSPNRAFVAKLFSEFNYPTGVETIEIWTANGSVLWVVPYQGEMPTGDPRPSLSIYGWSADSSELFFYYGFAYDGFWTIFNGNDLQSIAVTTGVINEIAPGCCIAFRFTKDMHQLAYTRGRQITIRDMATGVERTTEIMSGDFLQAGQIEWSPSGNKLVYHVLVNDWGNALMIYLDVNSMEQVKILGFFIEDYPFDGWTEDENLRIRIDGTISIVDTKTGIASVVGTMTPHP